MTPFLSADIEREEGREYAAYPDPLSALGRACSAAGLKLHNYPALRGWAALDGSPWTIGVGHTSPEVHEGLTWSAEQIEAALAADIAKAAGALKAALPWFSRLTDERQDVLVQMAFQMGAVGVLAFKNTLRLVEAGDYTGAAEGMLKSKWAAQTPARAGRLAKQMQTGKRP